MKKYIVLFLTIMLCGCSAGNEIVYDKEALNKSDLTFVGIPTVLGLGASGTRFPVSPHYSLTAKHVAKYTTDKVIAYHPTCDVALVRHDNKEKDIPTFSSVGVSNQVVDYGYSFISIMPVSSKGKVISYTKLGSGYNTIACPVMYSDMGARKGMSGGPVYSGSNIVGVLISYQEGYIKEGKSYDAPGSLFVPFQNIISWLTNELNKTEDKGLLKIDHSKDFYNNDSGDNVRDKIKNEVFEK